VPEVVVNLTASIYSISAIGELIVRFSHQMNTDLNLSLLNETMIQMYIEPAEDRHKTPGFDLTKLNFTWNATSFKGRDLVFSLNFTDPLSISPLADQDRFVWVLNETYKDWFFSSELKKSLYEDSWLL
jgi:hypothetical protein